jgi:hypothetical protein
MSTVSNRLKRGDRDVRPAGSMKKGASAPFFVSFCAG